MIWFVIGWCFMMVVSFVICLFFWKDAKINDGVLEIDSSEIDIGSFLIQIFWPITLMIVLIITISEKNIIKTKFEIRIWSSKNKKEEVDEKTDTNV